MLNMPKENVCTANAESYMYCNINPSLPQEQLNILQKIQSPRIHYTVTQYQHVGFRELKSMKKV